MTLANVRGSASEDLEKQAVARPMFASSAAASNGAVVRTGRRRPSIFTPKGQQFPLFHAWRP